MCVRACVRACVRVSRMRTQANHLMYTRHKYTRTHARTRTRTHTTTQPRTHNHTQVTEEGGLEPVLYLARTDEPEIQREVCVCVCVCKCRGSV